MRQLSLLLAVLLPVTAHAAPTTDDNAGRWSDTFVDDGGVLDPDGAEWDVAGRRVVLSEVGTEGTFLTAPIEPASFSAWGGLYVDYAAASDATVKLWVVSGATVYGAGGATGTLAARPTPLPLGASDRAGYNARADLGLIPTGASTLQVLVAMTGATLPPAVNALEVSWTPKSIVTSRLEAPATVSAAETIGVRVNVAVSFVDARDLVVEAALPVALPNAASALQDQKVSFVSATHGGALSPDGTKVVWSLGTRKAGETFTLVYTTRTQMGVLDQVVYRTTATARLSNGADAVPTPVQTTLASTPGPVLERTFGAGAYRIAGVDYVFPDTDLEVIVQGWNYKLYPGAGGETLFDAYVWDDISDLLGPAGSAPTAGAFAISHGGQFTAVAVPLPNGKTIPANSVYWRKDATHWPTGNLTVGQGFSYSYKVHVGKLTTDGGVVVRGRDLTPCAKLESHFASQLNDTAPAGAGNKLCRAIKVDEPFAPSGLFAKGEEIRGVKGVGAGDDLRNPLVKAAYGETMSYFLFTYNQGVSRLDDIVMIDRIPEGMVFEDAFLPAGANGEILYYVGDDAPDPRAPPAYDDGAFGAGWSTAAPADRASVTWVGFRVPELLSIYFPDTDPSDGTTPTSVEAEIVVSVLPPVGDCPVDVELENVGLFYVHGYTPPNKPTVVLDPPIAADNVEKTVVVPDLPSLAGSILTDSPSTAVAGQPLVYTLHIRNASPPGSLVPLDDALGVSARINIPKVPANGVPTALLVDGVSAPGGSIAYSLPDYVTVTYPAALPPDASRVVTLTTRVPAGVIDGTAWSLGARVDWSDDLCGPSSATLSQSTNFFGLPALEVVKTADFAFGMTGTELTYTLEYVNAAQSPSTRSWVVDRIAPGSRLLRAEIPVPGGQVWFSTVQPTTLPAALSPTDPFTDQRITTHFVRALDTDADGWVTPPTGATYVAFLVDDTTLSPPQLVTGTVRSVSFEAVIESPTLGGIVANQAAILSKELIQAIGNKINFTVTGRPGLRLTKSCLDVAATGEGFSYTVDYYNDSANDDDSVVLVETLPAGLEPVDVSHAWNDAYGGDEDPVITIDGGVITVTVPGLAPLEGGRLTIAVRVADDLGSGTPLLAETLGTAYGDDESTRSGYAACTVFVENADLYVTKLADNPAPRAGETFNYTVVVSNQGKHDALDVRIADALPSQLDFVPGSVVVTPAPWTAGPPSDPVLDGGALVWSADFGNGLGRGGDASGLLGGESGNVSLIFQARVKPGVLPGTTIENCASASTETGEDANYDNEGCATITTPLPDPWVIKSGPPLKKPGEKVTWTISFGNGANEVAGGVVLIDKLPDNPLPGGDGKVDVTFTGALAPAGVQIWTFSCPIATGCAAAPTFSITDTTGWSQSAVPPAGQAISYVAFWIGDLAPLAPTRTVQVSATLVSPGGVLSSAGALFEPCATIAMTTSGYADQDASNNTSCDDTRIPGIDLLAIQTSEPSGRFPGVEPGDTITWHIGVVNSGTVPAFGITLADALPPEVELVAPPSGAVVVTDASGEIVGPINTGGVRVDAQVSWTLVGATFHLGATAAGPLGYQSLGLAPGDRATITLVTRVKDGVANQTILANTVTVATTGVEEILTNNSATAEVGVYRADPFVYKTVAASSGVDAGVVDVGDTVTWRLEYGNAGDFPAREVLIEDAIPQGLAFVVGSVGGVDPDTMTVVYSNDGGASWGYVPAGASGTVDAAVTHVRVVWTGALPAPASGVFSQTTAIEFEAGDHVNTQPDAGLEGVVPLGGNTCDSVTCEPVKCDFGSYIPEGGCCQVCRQPLTGCGDKLPVEPGCDGKESAWSGCYFQREADKCEAACLLELTGPAYEAQRACEQKYKDATSCLVKPDGGCTPPTTPVWDDCWTVACPDRATWSCEQQLYLEPCSQAYYVGMKSWATCIDQGAAPQACALLLPQDDCTPCMAQACAQTATEHLSYGQYSWWVVQSMGKAARLAAAAASRRGVALPEGALPGPTLEGCAEPLSCVAEAVFDSCPPGCNQICTERAGCICLCDIGEELGKDLEAAAALPSTGGRCAEIASELGGYHENCLAEIARVGAQGAYAYLPRSADGILYFDRVSTTTHEVGTTFPSGSEIETWSHVLDPDYLWVVSYGTNELLRGDRFSETVNGRVAFEASDLYGVAVDPDSVWLASESQALLWQVDRETLTVIAHPVPDFEDGGGNEQIAVDHDAVWIATGEPFVARVDKADPTSEPRVIWLPERDDDVTEVTFGVAIDGEQLWVSTTDRVYRIDTITEEVVRVSGIQLPDGVRDIWAVEHNADYAWAVADVLYRIDKETLEVTVIDGITEGFGLAPSDDGVWVNGLGPDGETWFFHVGNDGVILGSTPGGDDFYVGDVTGYIYDRMFGAALPEGGADRDPSVCDYIMPPTCEAPESCFGSTYTSPTFPAPDEGNVIAWGRAVIGQLAPEASEDKQIRYSVLDADSGQAVAGFADLPYPDGGTIPLGAIDPAAHPRLALRASFTGTNTGRFIPIDDGEPGDQGGECSKSFEPWLVNSLGQVAGNVHECSSAVFLWSEADGMVVYRPDDGTYSASPYGLNDAGIIVGVGDRWTAVGTEQYAYVWSQSDGWIDIMESVGHTFMDEPIVASTAGAVSEDGRVAGLFRTEIYAATEGEPELVGYRDLPFVWSPGEGLVAPEMNLTFNLGYFADNGYGMRFVEPNVVAGVMRVGGDESQQAFDVFRWNLDTGEVERSGLPLTTGALVKGAAADGTLAISDGWSGSIWMWPPAGDPVEVIIASEGDGKLPPGISAVAADGTAVGYAGSFNSYDAWIRHPDGTVELLPRHPDYLGGVAATSINDDGDIGVELYSGGESRIRTTRAAIWDGERYLLVDGYPTDVTSTFFSDYAWDGLSALNPARQLIGYAATSGFGEQQSIAYLWQPDPDNRIALLDWRVIYETDRNPSVSVTTAVEGACADAITNTATVSTASPQVTTANDSSSAAIAMNRADVRVTVRPTPAVVGPADETFEPIIDWQVEVQNEGPGIARGVELVVDLPGYGVETLGLPDLGPGETWDDSFPGSSSQTEPNASIVGAAEVTTASLDCNAGNDAGTGTVFVGSWPNVFVTVDGPPVATAGETFTHEVTWGNNGNDTATDVTLTLSVPPGLTIVEIISELCELDGATLNCGDVEPGGGETILVVLATAGCDAVSGDPYEIGAAITTDAIEVDVSDNLAADATQIVAPPGGLTLAVAQSRGAVVAGEAVTWTVYFENTGLGAIADTTIVVPVPAGATYVAGSASAGGALVGGQLVWAGGLLAPGQGGAVQARLVMTASATVTATATGDGACAGAAQGSVTVGAPGLAIVKGVDKPQICGLPNAGDGTLAWTITVSNPTAAAIADVVVTDVVPAGMTYVANSIYGAGADASDAMRPRWSLGTLAPGAALTVGYTTRVVAPVAGVGGIVVGGAATATSGQVSVKSGDTVVRLVCEPGLALVKAWSAGCALPGADRGVTLRVVNTGREPVAGVTVFDVLPVGMSFVSATSGGVVGGVFVAELGTIGPGREATVELALAIAPSVAGGTVYTNAATLLAEGLVPQVSNQVGGAVLACDDGNVCTEDACEPTLGCVFPDVQDGASCDDDDACTTVDVCERGACAGTTPVVCQALGQCHEVGTCDPATGVCSNPVSQTGKPCDDGTVCTFEEYCTAGVCGDGGVIDCDDDNTCTTDSCDAELGCVYTNVADGTTCDDENLCSTASECRAGACAATTYQSCSDGDPCTADSCAPGEGCVNVAHPSLAGTTCSDGSPCTTGDVCDAEGGCAGVAITCGEPGECELAGACNEATGVCDFPAKPGETPLPIRLTDLGAAGDESAATALAGDLTAGWIEGEGGGRRIALWVDGGVSDLGAGEATGVNAAGQIVGVRGAGEVVFVDGATTVLWTRGTIDGAPAPIHGPTAAGVVAGQAAVTIDQVTSSRPAMRLASGAVVTLAPPDATHVAEVAALGGGWVVGTEEGTTGAIDVRAFRWNGVAARELLALPTGAMASAAYAVGAAGHIGGAVTTASGEEAVIWRPDGTAVVIEPACLPAGACLEGTAIVGVDGAGRFIGRGQLADGSERAFVGELGGDVTVIEPAGAIASSPVAISDALAVGTWTTAAGVTLGFAWSEDEGLVEIAAPGAGVAPTHVSGGWALGRLTAANGDQRAFLWSARGLEDLGSLGGGVSEGLAVGEDGRVVGWSATGSGEGHAFTTGVPALGCVACEVDADAPVLVCPSGLDAIECVAGGATVALGVPSARDACTFPVEITSDAPDSFPVGATDVTFTATDGAGNAAACAVTVMVVDTTAPTIACPEPRSVVQPEGVCGATVELAPTVGDACDAATVKVLSNAPTSFPVGVTEVAFTAIDGAGNTAACTTTVTVTDGTPFVIACDPSLTVEAPADACGWPEAITATVTDECAPEVIVESDTDAFPIGQSQVVFRAENAAGETASCTTALTVLDVTDPVIACNTVAVLEEAALPSAIAPSAADACTAVLEVSGLACVRVDDGVATPFTEGCDASVEGAVVIVGHVDAGVEHRGGVAVRWTVTATDPSGNSATLDCETTLRRDRDGDGVVDAEDNCVEDANADQLDFDEDGVGNVCDELDDAIEALGDGGCSGGAASGLGLALFALALVALRRRARV